MTARETRIGLIAFALLTAGLAVNLVAFQAGPPAASVKSRGERSIHATADRSEKSRRLALPAAATDVNRNAAVPAVSTTTAIGAEVVRGIQRELQARGYEAGGSDGVAGLVTRAAIMAFEHDHGIALSGEPDEVTLKRILLGGAAGGDVPARAERAAGAEAVIRTVQQTLSGLGYNTGKVDGRLGEDTQRAIREYEADQKMPETGRVSGHLIARLAKSAGGGRLPGAR